MKVFGIDPGSERTGYGCLETDGSRHRLVVCGAIATPPRADFPAKLLAIHDRLSALLSECRPDAVVVESLFYAANVRTALKLGHVRGVIVFTAVEGGYPVTEYTPAEIKRAVVGYGRAEKRQVQEMVRLLLGLPTAPSPYDAADALAAAICHVHHQRPATIRAVESPRGSRRAGARSWRQYRPGGDRNSG